MKNSAVKALVRTQFNIPENVDIRVECISCINGTYNFEVEWWDENQVRYQCNMNLPHIEFHVDTRFACA